MNKFAQHYLNTYVSKRAAAGEKMSNTQRPSFAGAIVGANAGLNEKLLPDPVYNPGVLRMRPSNYGFTSGPSMSNAPRPNPGTSAPAAPNLLYPLSPNRPSSLKDRGARNLPFIHGTPVAPPVNLPYLFEPNRPSLKDRAVPLQDLQSMSNAPRPNPVRPVQEATLGQSMSNAPRPNPVRPVQEATLGQSMSNAR